MIQFVYLIEAGVLVRYRYILPVLGLLLIFGFHNCAKVNLSGGSSGNQACSSVPLIGIGGDGGQTFDGIRNYLHRIATGKCPDNNIYDAEIAYDFQNSKAVLIRKNCQTLQFPQEVSAQVASDKSSVTYDNLSFDLQTALSCPVPSSLNASGNLAVGA